WAGTCVADSADVPMFWFGCCLDASAIEKSESLVPKANSEHWYLVRGFDDVARGVKVLRVVWGAWSRGNDHMAKLAGAYPLWQVFAFAGFGSNHQGRFSCYLENELVQVESIRVMIIE